MERQRHLDFKKHDVLAAAEAGLPGFLLRPLSKVPLRKGWRDEATTDRRRLADRLRAHPGCNIAIATGRGIVAIDIDPDAGGEASYALLTERHGLLPRTATSMTGGGGWHCLFRVDRPVANRVGLLPGIDIRGEGGYIVAPPSIHPETGRVYAWANHPRDGIAPLPKWLLKLLTRPSAPPRGGPVRADRVGDVAALTDEMIRRFPVAGPGRRNGQMNRAIASLLGRGYEPGTILEVVDGWHSASRDRHRTPADQARREAESCLASKLRSPTFAMAAGAVDHRAECAERDLGGEVVALIRGGRILAAPGPQEWPPSLNAKRLTRGDRIGTRLCESSAEVAFVEALVVHATHKARLGKFAPGEPGGRLLMTHDQVREIVLSRGGPSWDDRQFERLKVKYISRPSDGKPATRFELLSEVAKGRRRPNGPPGVPSEYRATGILLLLSRPD